MAFTDKMQTYCGHRAAGLRPRAAALASGYLPTSAAVTAARMEQRKDIQTEIARIKKQIKAGKPPTLSPPAADDDDESDKSPLAPWKLRDKYDNPLALLLDVSNNPKAPMGIRIQCAKDALPYCHARKGENGKKQQAADDAAKVGKGKKPRFATQATPLRRVA